MPGHAVGRQRASRDSHLSFQEAPCDAELRSIANLSASYSAVNQDVLVAESTTTLLLHCDTLLNGTKA
jgi:hypothetical protein